MVMSAFFGAAWLEFAGAAGVPLQAASAATTASATDAAAILLGVRENFI
jgi:hypothetical protein